MSHESIMSRFGQRWIDLMLARPKVVLAIGLVVTIVSVVLSTRLQLDSDLRSLMPKDDPVVSQLEELEAGFGTIGSVDVLVKGGSLAARHAFADALAERLRDHPMLRDIDAAPESEFFVDHALYYLSDAEIEELAEHVMAVEHHGLCSRAPEVCVEPPDPDADEKLRDFIEHQRDKARKSTRFDGYYEREGIDALVVFLFPERPSDDLQYCQDLTDEMRREIAALQASEGAWTGTDLTFNVVGPYVSKGEERRQVPRDMIRSGVIGVTGVTLVLFLLFRSWRAVVVLTVPLLAGVAWSMGLTELLLSRLNSMTSLISTVILGLGIDAGIHLLGKVRRECEQHSERDAIRRAFSTLMGPLLAASTTTIGAFAVMTASSFPVFREFGLIGGSGVALCLLAMLTLFPALLSLMGVPRLRRRDVQREPALGRAILHRAGRLLLVCGLLSLVMVPGFILVRAEGFEGDVRNLKSDHMRRLVDADLDVIAEIFGQHTRPSIVLVDDYTALDDAYARATARHSAYKLEHDDSTIVRLFSARELMPPREVNMQARKARIVEITEDFSETTWARIEGRTSDPEDDEFAAKPADGAGAAPAAAPRKETSMTPEEGRRLRAMLEAGPFTVDDLPPRVLARLRTKDGRYGIFAYPNFYGQILRGSQLIEESKAYSPDGAPFVGEEAVFAAMYRVMMSEWPTVLGVASLVVLVIVFLQVRSVTRTLWAMLPLFVSAWWMLGLMGLLGIKFSLFNIPVLPAIVGIGIDHGVYLMSAMRQCGPGREDMEEAVDDTSRAILAASGTTAIGFGCLLIADSGGLRGIGAVAVLGVMLAALAAIAILPALAELGRRRRASTTRRA